MPQVRGRVRSRSGRVIRRRSQSIRRRRSHQPQGLAAVHGAGKTYRTARFFWVQEASILLVVLRTISGIETCFFWGFIHCEHWRPITFYWEASLIEIPQFQATSDKLCMSENRMHKTIHNNQLSFSVTWDITWTITWNMNQTIAFKHH